MAKRKIPLSIAVPGLGDRLRLAREMHRLSQAAAARLVGVTASAWNHWEKNTHEPELKHMLVFRRETKVPLDWIYAGDREVISPAFLRFIIDFGSRADAPEVARQMRHEWGLPLPTPSSGISAGDVAEALMPKPQTARREPERGPKRTLHEERHKLRQ